MITQTHPLILSYPFDSLDVLAQWFADHHIRGMCMCGDENNNDWVCCYVMIRLSSSAVHSELPELVSEARQYPSGSYKCNKKYYCLFDNIICLSVCVASGLGGAGNNSDGNGDRV